MTRPLIWPTSGTGNELATLLRNGANDGLGSLSGGPAPVVDGYLDWVGVQVRMLQRRVTPSDLDRLVTTPRYWATFANPLPDRATVGAVLEEVQYRAALMNEAADSLTTATGLWRLQDQKFANLAVIDTNFWVEHEGSFDTIDWHKLIAGSEGPGYLARDEELRIVVPMVVVDELDGLAHRSNLRPKVIGATRWLYKHLGEAAGSPRDLVEAMDGHGPVTAQLVFEPHAHVRLPNNDDEIVETAVRLRDFLGLPPKQVFFLTYDSGAAFRAGHAGLMPRLLTK